MYLLMAKLCLYIENLIKFEYLKQFIKFNLNIYLNYRILS